MERRVTIAFAVLVVIGQMLAPANGAETKALTVGDVAPEFELQGTDGKTYKLSDFKGKSAVVVAWYPKALTGGCTRECKSLRENGAALRKFEVAHFGASCDPVERNQEFAKKLDLDYPLLSDTGGKVAGEYGILSPRGTSDRVTFIIGADGKVAHIFNQVKVGSHGEDVVAKLEELKIEPAKTPEALKFEMNSLAGEKVDLAKYRDKVVMMVNVASECGLTPQYEQLQELHKKYSDKGLAILGFPCNQFGKQEPGDSKAIGQFCEKNYGVEFDMFEKVNVNGDDACDLYKHLTALELEPKEAGKVSWNFEKFLLDRNGKVIARFEPRTSPDDPAVLKMIETALAD